MCNLFYCQCNRPVVALIQIEIQKVNVKEQSKVHESVMQSMGPADPTIVVNCDDDDDGEGIDVSELLELLETCGTAVLVRVVDDDILVTFEDGRSALKALHLDGKEVSGKVARIKLKSESLLSNTDLTIQTLISGDSSFASDISEDILSPTRGRALSDLLSTSSENKHIQVLEPIKIQSAELEGESSESEPEDAHDYEEDYDSDDVDSRTEADRQIEEPSSKPKPPRPAQPKRPKPPRPAAARPKPPNTRVVKFEEQALRSIPDYKDNFEGSQEALEHFDPLAQIETDKPKRPPPPKRPAPPKVKLKTTQVEQSNQSKSEGSQQSLVINSPTKPTTEVKTIRKSAGSSRTDIGMPFNVQHLGHVSADNIEALLLAAKNDPTLLPSFMTADVSKDNKHTKTGTTDELPKETSPLTGNDEFSVQKSTKVELSSGTQHAHPVPIRRSKPTPAPRPRSYAEVKDGDTTISATARAPVDPEAKPLVKPKPLTRKDVFDAISDAPPNKYTPHLQPARSEMDVCSQDRSNPPVAPMRRRKAPPTRPMSVPNLLQYAEAEINEPQVDNSHSTSKTDSGLTQNVSDEQENTTLPRLPNRSAPPPVPPRVDLE